MESKPARPALLVVMHAWAGDVHLAAQVLARLPGLPALVQVEAGTPVPQALLVQGVTVVTTARRGSLSGLWFKLLELLPAIEASGCTHVLRIDPDTLPLPGLTCALLAHPDADLLGAWQTSCHAGRVRVIAGYCALLSVALLRHLPEARALHTEEASWTAAALAGPYVIRAEPRLLHTYLPLARVPAGTLALHPFQGVLWPRSMA